MPNHYDEEMMQEERPQPQAGGGATPEQVMQAQQEQVAAENESIMSQAPEPSESYDYKAIKDLSDSMGAFTMMIDETLELPPFDIPEGESRLDGKLPMEVFVPYVRIMAFLATLEEGQKYVTDPEELGTNSGLRKASANFDRMQKDKKLIKKLQEGGAPAEPEAQQQPEAPAKPGEMSEMDREIMEM